MTRSERVASLLPEISDELARLADYERKARSRRDRALRHLEKQVPDPALRAKLTPDAQGRVVVEARANAVRGRRPAR